MGRRSIPAPAGEPPRRRCWTPSKAVYPRACGGTFWRRSTKHIVDGSIPAPAGEPDRGWLLCRHPAVYPRACGGTGLMEARRIGLCGLSPRLRGNLVDKASGIGIAGSIPAPAGEPFFGVGRGTHLPVYPRACGGTLRASARWPAGGGLSPRLRGNPAQPLPRYRPFGSIPAPAGEPQVGLLSLHIREVYPRACGGTTAVTIDGAISGGLSPRLRGNRGMKVVRFGKKRSIPAPAGEPRSS